MSKYGYLEVFQKVLGIRDNESRLYLLTYAPNKDSDQSAHQRCLITTAIHLSAYRYVDDVDCREFKHEIKVNSTICRSVN